MYLAGPLFSKAERDWIERLTQWTDWMPYCRKRLELEMIWRYEYSGRNAHSWPVV